MHRKGSNKHSLIEIYSGSLCFSSTTDKIHFSLSQLYPSCPITELCLCFHSWFAFLGVYCLVFLGFLIFLFTLLFERSTQFNHSSLIVLGRISLELFLSFCLKLSPSFTLPGSLENFIRGTV